MKVCEWKLHGIESNTWNSGCGKSHHMGYSRQNPKQAGMKTCPYCGQRLITNTTGWVDGWDKYDPSTWTPAEKEELLQERRKDRQERHRFLAMLGK